MSSFIELRQNLKISLNRQMFSPKEQERLKFLRHLVENGTIKDTTIQGPSIRREKSLPEVLSGTSNTIFEWGKGAMKKKDVKDAAKIAAVVSIGIGSYIVGSRENR